MVISNKQLLDEVFVISVISHDVGLHDVIGGHQASIHREIYGASNLYLAKTTHGSRDSRVLRVRRDYKLALFAAFGRSLRENYTLF